MNAAEENTGSEAPKIAIVPEMTPAEHIAELTARLDQAHAANLRLGVELQDTQTHLDGAQTAIENLTKTVTEKEADIKMCHAELEEQHRLLTDAQKERDEYAARWEEVEKQPFIGSMFVIERQTGRLREDLTDAYYKVIDAASATGKAGSVTLTITYKQSEEHAGAIIAVPKVKFKAPEEKPEKAFFFMEDGRVTEDDPADKKQPRLPLKGDKSRKPKANASAKTATVDLDAALEPVYEEAAKIAVTEAVSVDILKARLNLGYTKAVVIFAALKSRGALKVEAV